MSEKSRDELLLEYEKDYLQRLVSEGKLKAEDVQISEEVRREMTVKLHQLQKINQKMN